MAKNQLLSARWLVENWDSPTHKLPPVELKGGLKASQSGLILTPHDPDFKFAIEPGVRPLLLALIKTLGCVTYSSCQGHYRKGKVVEAHIGIIPYNHTEFRLIYHALSRMLDTANLSSEQASIRLTKLNHASGFYRVIDIRVPYCSEGISYPRKAAEVFERLKEALARPALLAADLRCRRGIELLVLLGAHKRRHSGGTLLDHLSGTASILNSWGCERAVCRAGLMHSIYGTSTYPHPLLRFTDEGRSVVARVIGINAERLVFDYSHKRNYDNIRQRVMRQANSAEQTRRQ